MNKDKIFKNGDLVIIRPSSTFKHYRNQIGIVYMFNDIRKELLVEMLALKKTYFNKYILKLSGCACWIKLKDINTISFDFTDNINYWSLTHVM